MSAPSARRDLTDAELRARARTLWPACLGGPFNVIVEHGISMTVTSRCCEFHEKLTLSYTTLRDAARAEQRETSVKIVQADEEMDGAMPDTIWNACVTRDGCAEVLRAAVRVTKRNIIAAIRTQGETR